MIGSEFARQNEQLYLQVSFFNKPTDKKQQQQQQISYIEW